MPLKKAADLGEIQSCLRRQPAIAGWASGGGFSWCFLSTSFIIILHLSELVGQVQGSLTSLSLSLLLLLLPLLLQDSQPQIYEETPSRSVVGLCH